MIICSEYFKWRLWGSRGQRFDPAYFHQKIRFQKETDFFFLIVIQHSTKTDHENFPMVCLFNVKFGFG